LALTQIIIPLLAITPWLLHRSAIQTANTDRHLIFSGISIETLQAGLGNVGRWVMPGNESVEHYGGNVIQIGIGVIVLLVITTLLMTFAWKIISNKNIINIKLGFTAQGYLINIYPVSLFVLLYFLSILFLFPSSIKNNAR